MMIADDLHDYCGPKFLSRIGISGHSLSEMFMNNRIVVTLRIMVVVSSFSSSLVSN